MKKIAFSTLILCALLAMSGCSSTGQESSDSSTVNSKKHGEVASTEQTIKKEKDGFPTFSGKLIADPVIDKDSVSLSFESVDVINDPDDIHDTINSNGVVLNADKELFVNDKELTDLKKGGEVEFTLEKQPALTFSIPPQIPGMSIKSIKIISE